MSEYTEEIIDKRTGKCISIAHERMRSAQEVQIANFLYLNQIDYRYERPYEYHILKSRKPYTPDFTITRGDKVAYLEHFGITEDGKNNRYNEFNDILVLLSIDDLLKDLLGISWD